jgi:hypothetical protein
MKTINNVFDRLDMWRHLPAYQLERRADIYFSLYLPEALGAHFGFPVNELVVPEFPVRIGTVDPSRPDGDKSCKIDYLAISKDGAKAIFVELKTETRSRRTGQDDFLVLAEKADFADILKGVCDIFRVTTYKRKYCHLLNCLEKMSLIEIPPRMKEIMARKNLNGITKASSDIKITSRDARSRVLYIQPKKTTNEDGKDCLFFDEFIKTVGKYEDPISKRFGKSLIEWKSIEAGASIF